MGVDKKLIEKKVADWSYSIPLDKDISFVSLSDKGKTKKRLEKLRTALAVSKKLIEKRIVCVRNVEEFLNLIQEISTII